METKNSSRSKLSSAMIAALAALVLIPSIAWTKVEFDSNQLMMRNADEMAELVRKRIKKAQDIQASQEVDDDVGLMAESGAIAQLRDALRIVLSRPDQDGARTNLFARVRRELQDLNALDDTLKSLVRESLAALKSSSTPVRRQVTHIVILENLMAEIKPELSTNDEFKQLITEIRDANIKVTDKARREQRLRSMSSVTSPSDTAAKIIPKDNPKKK